jgi:hypothetical protein
MDITVTIKKKEVAEAVREYIAKKFPGHVVSNVTFETIHRSGGQGYGEYDYHELKCASADVTDKDYLD